METILPTATDSREDPLGIAMSLPKAAQARDHCGRDGYLAVLAALGIENASAAARGIDVRRANPDRFAHAQAAVVDEAQDGFEAATAEAAQQLTGMVTADDFRQGLVTPDFQLPPKLPIALEEILVEKPQSDDGLVERGGPQLLLIPAEDKIIEDLALGQFFEGTIRVMLGQFAHLPQVLRLGAAPQ